MKKKSPTTVPKHKDMDKEHAYEMYISTHFGKARKNIKREFDLYYRLFKKNYSSLLPKDKGANILDIGCGMGHFLYYLKKGGYKNISGLDVSRENAEFCRKNGFNIACKDGRTFLKPQKEKYDVIVMNDVIEHLDKGEIFEMLSMIHSALKKGGTVMVKTPNMANPLCVHSRYIDFTHEVGFTEESLSQALRVSGFREVFVYPLDIYVKKNPLFNMIGKLAFWFQNTVLKLLFIANGRISTRIFTKSILAVGRK